MKKIFFTIITILIFSFNPNLVFACQENDRLFIFSSINGQNTRVRMLNIADNPENAILFKIKIIPFSKSGEHFMGYVWIKSQAGDWYFLKKNGLWTLQKTQSLPKSWIRKLNFGGATYEFFLPEEIVEDDYVDIYYIFSKISGGFEITGGILFLKNPRTL